MRGGYQIIDCVTLTALDGTQTVKGAFAKAKKGRPIMIENCMGISGMTYDIATGSSTVAYLPLIAYVSGVLKPAKIEISSDDEFTLSAI